MSDQELAEVFADSDDENVASDSHAGGIATRSVMGRPQGLRPLSTTP